MGKTIMIVDADQRFHDLYTAILKNSEFAVISVYDGYEALTKLEKEKPDLIITDILLNMMTGDALFMNVKCMLEYKDIPFIMVSNVSMHSYKYLKEFDQNLVFIKKKYLTKERLLEEMEQKLSCSSNSAYYDISHLPPNYA